MAQEAVVALSTERGERGPRGTSSILLAALLMSNCGGDDGGGSGPPPPSPPPTVTEKNLYSFGASQTDGLYPTGLLVHGSDGNLYGTTQVGGLPNCYSGGPVQNSFYDGCGTVFKISPAGEETILYQFVGTPGDDTGNPVSLIQASDGNFYGAADNYMGSYDGTIFKLTPQGVETILYAFSGGADGGAPTGLIQGSDGNFYGTTARGGARNCACGTVFKLTPQGVETVLYSFGATGTDGADPVGQLVEGSDGNFYGVTSSGGLPNDEPMPSGTAGTVFKVTPEGIETVLYMFAYQQDGISPFVGLVQGSDGTLYGMTEYDSTLFSITPQGVKQTLHVFGSSDGANPLAQLTLGSDGNLYGTTSAGGENGGGTFFEITPEGTFTLLYSFPAIPSTINSGVGPNTSLVETTPGTFYGATQAGGANNYGYFFQLVVK